MGRITARHRVLRIDLEAPSDRGEFATTIDTVAAEEPLEIRLNDEPFSVLMRTPGHDIELAHGLLRAEGVIRSREDVSTARFCSDLDSLNVLNVQTPSPMHSSALSSTRNLTAFGGCGLCGTTTIDAIETALPQPVLPHPWPATSIAHALDDLRARQDVFARTGGVHAAAMVQIGADELTVAREDVGRHNAVDKALGWALINQVETRGAMVVVSSRASFEIVQKVAMAGISTLACVSAPSTLAIDAAERLGVCLVAFARGPRMNAYTYTERLAAAKGHLSIISG